MPASARQFPPAWRLGAFYGLLFLISGASLPYLPVWLRSEGLTGAQIGVILSLPYLFRVAAGPAVAVWADGFQERRTPLVICAAAAVSAFVGLSLAEGFTAITLLWLAASTAISAVLPLTDVISLRIAQRHGSSFGRPRSVGSATFILASLGVGALLANGPTWTVLAWMIAAGVVTIAAAAFVLPRERVSEDGAAPDSLARVRGVGALLKRRRFMLVIVSAGLIQAAHGFHYGFSALLWREQGLSELWTGVLWGGGVVAEIAFLWTSEFWRKRIGPERLLAWSAAAAVLRWTVAGFGPPLWVLLPLHLLHAFTFAGVFVASTRMVDAATPTQSASAAHTLSASLQMGLFMGLATLASGALFDLAGARGYFAMSGMASLGLIGALVLARRPAATA